MLTWADIVLLAILAISALVGIWRGFVSEVMSLVVWIGAFWLAFAFGPAAAAMFEAHVDAPTARWFLGYATVFLAALVVGGLCTWLIGKLVRGAAVGCVLVLVMGFTPLPQEPAWRQSQLLPGFVRGADWLRTWLPEALATHLSFDPVAAAALPLPSVPRDNDASTDPEAVPPEPGSDPAQPAPSGAR